MKTLTVREAVDRVKDGKSLEGYVLDYQVETQVKVSDALMLNRGGIVVPEEYLFYDDENIAYDEEIDELVLGEEITGMSWEEKASHFREDEKNQNAVSIHLRVPNRRVKSWIENNGKRIAKVLEVIVLSLYNAEKKLQNTLQPGSKQDRPG